MRDAEYYKISPYLQRVGEVEIDQHEPLYKLSDYVEFSKHYAKSKIVNLDVIHDRNLIMKNLKVGYQHEVQEYFVMIAYDYSNRVISVEELFKGGLNSSIVDHKVILVLTHS